MSSPVQQEQPPSRSLPEGDAVPIAFADQKPPPTIASEGDINQGPTPSMTNQESSSRSTYWDGELPEKRRRKPNQNYSQLSQANSKIRLGDLDQKTLMCIDREKNELQAVPTYYSKMMGLLQLATDLFPNEIDGDLHPCLLASKACQADNPTYEEAMNGPHRDDSSRP
jgi:hypothetical protein